MRLYRVKNKVANTIMIKQNYKSKFELKNGRNYLTIKNCTIKTSNGSIPYSVTFEDSENKKIKNVFIMFKSNDEDSIFDSIRFSFCKLRLTYLEFVALIDRLKDYDANKEYDFTFSFVKEKETMTISFKESNSSIELQPKVEVKKEIVKEVIIEKPIIKETIEVEQKIEEPKKIVKSFKSAIDYSYMIPKCFIMPSKEERNRIFKKDEYNELNRFNNENVEEEEYADSIC